MSVPMRFGYKASSEQFGPRELLDYAILAEEVGFDSVFLSDHLQPWMHDGGHAPAALPWLGSAGEATKKVLLGTSVLTPTFRYHPGVIAQAFGTLGSLYPGRMILGVGTGEALNEVTLGIQWPDPPERFQRMKESIILMRRLWEEDRVTYEGDYYTVRGATIYDKPSQPVPIYIGASGPAATRLAGRMAEGWITTSGKASELYTDKLIPAFEDGLTKGGQTRDEVDTLMEVKVSFRPDRAKAMENTRFWAPLALKPEEKMGVEDPIEMQRLASLLPTERAASRFIVSDEVEEHIAQIERYIDLGFRHLVFHDPGHDQEAFLRLYGEEVLPRLRERHGA